jgi:hypothetical protein
VVTNGSSEGRRKLLLVLQTTTRGAVARVVQVCRQVVGRYADGSKKPAYHARKEFAEHYEIGMDDWDKPAVEPGGEPQKEGPKAA